MNKIELYENIQKDLLQKKLNSPIGFALIILLATCLGAVMAKGLIFSLIILCGVIGSGVVVYAFVNELFGLYLLIGIGSFTAFFGRITGVELPYGTMIEIFIFVLFLGVVLRKIINNDATFSIADDPIAICLVVLISYQILLFFNPVLPSRLGYFMVLKRSICMLLFYLICTYSFKNRSRIFSIIKYWLIIAFVVGAYGCKQEWLGFFNFEKNWLFSGIVKITLIYVDGRYRKFSFLDSPTNFGMFMATASVFIMVLLSGKFSLIKKAGMVIMLAATLLGLAYSGTRTAYVMVPAGLILFFLVNIHRRVTILLGIVCAVGVAFLLFAPTKDANVIRIRTAFNPSEDASFNVRDINRAKVQPYIYSHPIGSGLATIGGNGLRYNPNYELAGFPPDSEYLKTAIESGYIGYFLLLSVYGYILIITVKRFFTCQNQYIKTTYIALACALFTIIVANYSQETNFMFPNDINLMLLFALSASLHKFDPYFLKTKKSLI